MHSIDSPTSWPDLRTCPAGYRWERHRAGGAKDRISRCGPIGCGNPCQSGRSLRVYKSPPLQADTNSDKLKIESILGFLPLLPPSAAKINKTTITEKPTVDRTPCRSIPSKVILAMAVTPLPSPTVTRKALRSPTPRATHPSPSRCSTSRHRRPRRRRATAACTLASLPCVAAGSAARPASAVSSAWIAASKDRRRRPILFMKRAPLG
ncbi:hypothetical protein N658DRAFT_494900 [Parathielavia hyrcaniae]|uniref:Uncharacterized protein n=1 Tax=Parathielavia hyrcaniae TaxID=113614 RepID=A0AAN6Q3D7_9PEZI|nr:hypothetical protein N658DRAFT_494900 [Parathielavia hyrcaniae]